MITFHVITSTADQAACSGPMMGNACVRHHFWRPSGRWRPPRPTHFPADHRLLEISRTDVQPQWATGNMNIVNLSVAVQR